MKRNSDVHVHSTHSGGTSAPSEMAEMAQRLGLHNIFLADFGAIAPAQIDSLLEKCKDLSINVFSRANITPKTSRNLRQKLKRLRKKVDLVAVECSTEKMCRFASTNTSVDILSISPTARSSPFTDWVARNCIKNKIALELTLLPFIRFYGTRRVKLLRMWRKILSTALRHDVMLVIGTGALSKYELRGSREMLLLSKLVGVPQDVAKRSFSEIPFKLTERRVLERNRQIIAPGVRIIDEQEDKEW